MGAVRLVVVIQSEQELVLDGLVNRQSELGSVDALVMLVVSTDAKDKSTTNCSSDGTATDAVVDIAVPPSRSWESVRPVTSPDHSSFGLIGVTMAVAGVFAAGVAGHGGVAGALVAVWR